MTDREIRRAVKSLRSKYRISEVNYELLVEIADKLGYVVVEFNSIKNDDAVELLVEALELKSQLSATRGLTYCSEYHRIIFIDTKLSENEKCIVLSHELGHIQLGHLTHDYIVGQDVLEEYDANKFSIYLLKTKKHSWKVFSLAAAVALCLVILGLYFFSDRFNPGSKASDKTLADEALNTVTVPTPTFTPRPTKKPTCTLVPTARPEYHGDNILTETSGYYHLVTKNGADYLEFDTDYGPKYSINLDTEKLESVTCEHAELHKFKFEDNVLILQLISTELPYEVIYKFDLADTTKSIMSDELQMAKQDYLGVYYIYQNSGKNYVRIFYDSYEAIVEIDSGEVVYLSSGTKITKKYFGREFCNIEIYYESENQSHGHTIRYEKTIGTL